MELFSPKSFDKQLESVFKKYKGKKIIKFEKGDKFENLTICSMKYNKDKVDLISMNEKKRKIIDLLFTYIFEKYSIKQLPYDFILHIIHEKFVNSYIPILMFGEEYSGYNTENNLFYRFGLEKDVMMSVYGIISGAFSTFYKNILEDLGDSYKKDLDELSSDITPDNVIIYFKNISKDRIRYNEFARIFCESLLPYYISKLINNFIKYCSNLFKISIFYDDKLTEKHIISYEILLDFSVEIDEKIKKYKLQCVVSAYKKCEKMLDNV